MNMRVAVGVILAAVAFSMRGAEHCLCPPKLGEGNAGIDPPRS
jgi:hypothetical protein